MTNLRMAGVVSGHKELDRALAQLPKAMGKSTVRRGMRNSAKPMRDEMRARVPVDEKDLHDSITISTRLQRSQAVRRARSIIAMFVGPTTPKGFHAMFVEFGTAFMAATPFARPAYEIEKVPYVRRLGAELWKSLLKTAKTLGKKAKRGTLSASAKRTLRGR